MLGRTFSNCMMTEVSIRKSDHVVACSTNSMSFGSVHLAPRSKKCKYSRRGLGPKKKKLVYGLEFIQAPRYVCHKLDVVPLKGFKSSRTEDNIRRPTLDKRKASLVDKRIKSFYMHPRKTSEEFRKCAVQTTCVIKTPVRAPNQDPLRQCSFEGRASVRIVISNLRPGRLGDKWAYSISEGYMYYKGQAMCTKQDVWRNFVSAYN